MPTLIYDHVNNDKTQELSGRNKNKGIFYKTLCRKMRIYEILLRFLDVWYISCILFKSILPTSFV